MSDDAPKAYTVRLRERAVRDINSAFVGIAEVTSEDVAYKWREALTDDLASLATMPRRCPVVSERFRSEVRQLLSQRPGSRVVYRILFTITNEADHSPDPPTVLVLHVRNATARPLSRREIPAIEAQE